MMALQITNGVLAGMAKNAKQIAQEVGNDMKSSGLDAVTLRWPAFYALVERERIKPEFMAALRAALKVESILMAEGNSVVVFCKDFDFAPLSAN